MTRAELRARVLEAVDARREAIFALADDLLRHPEFGFKETYTADAIARALADLGLPVQTGLARTGVKAVLAGGEPGPGVAIVAEMDALPVPAHPFADPATGAAHACGHFAQVAMLLAAATGLVEADVGPTLAGSVLFVAVPAEESVDLEWRMGLRERGEIEFLGGKQELIRLGAFDDASIAMMTHSGGADIERFRIGNTGNGHVIKHARFVGRAAHAGVAPHRGVNALKAAMLALMAIDAQRETFRDDDAVRVHPILTKGGEAVNAVPADVRLETFVRARNIDALLDANHKVDRALRAGALAMGASVRITTMAGYLPVLCEPSVARVYEQNAVATGGRQGVTRGGHSGFSNDFGDLSHILAAANASCGGGAGTQHGPDFLVTDYERGILAPGKVMALAALDLLADGATEAREILASYQPTLSTNDYLALLRRLTTVEDYAEGGGA